MIPRHTTHKPHNQFIEKTSALGDAIPLIRQFLDPLSPAPATPKK